MHILFLSDNFPPEVNAPASRTFEHCREWVKAGNRVTVITCAPNFPTGKVFEGYRNRPFVHERMDGIDVIRVWSYVSANQGFLKRTLDYVSFAAAAVPASFTVRRPDIVVGTSPQFFTVCAAWLVGALKRRPFVFELRDIWPESIKAVGAMRDSAVIRALERLEMFLYRQAKLIVSVTEAFKTTLVARSVESDKIAVVSNGADLSRFRPTPKDERLAERLGLKGKLVAGYIGTLGMAHKLETVLDAAHALQTSGEAPEIAFLILGNGAEKKRLTEHAVALGLTNVLFLDSVPKAEVVHYWALLDLAITHLRDEPLFRTVVPSKLFECMAMGIPVLHGVEGESAEIVEREGVGLCFKPEDAPDLRRKLVQLARDPDARASLSRNGVAAARRWDRAELARLMLQALKATAARA